MRRSEREVTDFKELVDILKKCRVCSVAFYDSEFPYIVPLNFGYVEEKGEISLYFHTAFKGKKIDLLKSNSHVAFTTSANVSISRGNLPCDTGMNYQSLCGNGVMEIVENAEEKSKALAIIVQQYAHVGHVDSLELQQEQQCTQDNIVVDSTLLNCEFSASQMQAVTVLCLKVRNFTGKRCI